MVSAGGVSVPSDPADRSVHTPNMWTESVGSPLSGVSAEHSVDLFENVDTEGLEDYYLDSVPVRDGDAVAVFGRLESSTPSRPAVSGRIYRPGVYAGT